MEQITSRENKWVKELSGLLSSKKRREQSGLFALEGARLCHDAAESGVVVEVLMTTAEALENYPRLKEINAARHVLLAPAVAAKIGETQTPQGVFAICKKPVQAAPPVHKNGHYLLLAQLQDPGNLGTILRTAQALGIDGVLLSQCVDIYSPKVLRATMGGIFRIPLLQYAQPEEMVAQLQGQGVQVYAAALSDDACPATQLTWQEGCGVLIGNEGNGLPQHLIELCDRSVMLPMKGNAESLNAAVAASIFLWEMTK